MAVELVKGSQADSLLQSSDTATSSNTKLQQMEPV